MSDQPPDSALPTFTDVEWYTCQRGRVAAVSIDRDCRREDLLKVFRRVIIGGREYEVMGVEAYAVQMIRKGSFIGLLVRDGRPAA